MPENEEQNRRLRHRPGLDGVKAGRKTADEAPAFSVGFGRVESFRERDHAEVEKAWLVAEERCENARVTLGAGSKLLEYQEGQMWRRSGHQVANFQRDGRVDGGREITRGQWGHAQFMSIPGRRSTRRPEKAPE
ncbi:hypothetical protein THAOC_22407 [Thalassiosira oceanica]|uniref:Uncharacterized protein n=1 Tax=Thalassiosira oceanica TaxID=159749 RepID=K0S9E5_THAOC|nr:hypothetical protein THAOC_22407 [Thalassiosira oceanica]|eukprot:EJK57541.1 hypothetical protein THAOC_22407 [Thalassiosira oceanica]